MPGEAGMKELLKMKMPPMTQCFMILSGSGNLWWMDIIMPNPAPLKVRKDT